MKKTFLSVLFIVASFGMLAQTTWKVDPNHSKVRFSVSHLVVSEVDGNFKVFNGSFTTEGTDFTNAKALFTIDANSINTENEDRDAHLKSEDFFFTEKYPEISFTSTSFTKTGENTYQLKGDLTMRGVTKPVTLNATFGGTIEDPWGGTRAGMKVTGTLNRMDYGIAFNGKTKHGALMVGNTIDIEVKLELIKQ